MSDLDVAGVDLLGVSAVLDVLAAPEDAARLIRKLLEAASLPVKSCSRLQEAQRAHQVSLESPVPRGHCPCGVYPVPLAHCSVAYLPRSRL